MITTKQLKAETAALMTFANLKCAGIHKVAIRRWEMAIYPVGKTGYAVATHCSVRGHHMNIAYMNPNGEWQLVGDNMYLCKLLKGDKSFADVDLNIDAWTNGSLWVMTQINAFVTRNAAQDLEACEAAK